MFAVLAIVRHGRSFHIGPRDYHLVMAEPFYFFEAFTVLDLSRHRPLVGLAVKRKGAFETIAWPVERQAYQVDSTLLFYAFSDSGLEEGLYAYGSSGKPVLLTLGGPSHSWGISYERVWLRLGDGQPEFSCTLEDVKLRASN